MFGRIKTIKTGEVTCSVCGKVITKKRHKIADCVGVLTQRINNLKSALRFCEFKPIDEWDSVVVDSTFNGRTTIRFPDIPRDIVLINIKCGNKYRGREIVEIVHYCYSWDDEKEGPFIYLAPEQKADNGQTANNTSS